MLKHIWQRVMQGDLQKVGLLTFLYQVLGGVVYPWIVGSNGYLKDNHTATFEVIDVKFRLTNGSIKVRFLTNNQEEDISVEDVLML
jgi:hypothetical protein